MTIASLPLVACSTAPKTAEGKADIRQEAQAALSKAQAEDPSLVACLKDAEAYAVFPKVGKGAVGVGGAYGKGVLYEDGKATGYCDLSQATIGAQLGGQTYTEIVCFKTPEALARFKDGTFTLNAQATAVALKSGSSANAKYSDGVAVLTRDEKGLMAEAAVALSSQPASRREQPPRCASPAPGPTGIMARCAYRADATCARFEEDP
jgi:lipid-binding SYLF domain-containing protein